MNTKTLPAHLTSYDLLKTLAVVLMIIDHIGYFFFPEQVWWRVIGRMSVPIWFFLIGYAQTREIPRLFWVLGGLVLVSTLVAGEYLLPLNIVFTLILARLSVDWLFSHALRNKEAFAGMFFLLALMSAPSLMITEYGTLGLLFTLFGTIRRRKADVVAPFWMLLSYIAASAFTYILVQSLLMPSLDLPQFAAFVGGMVVLCVLLYRFEPHTFTSWPRLRVLQITGRYTLEIYTIHLLILRGIVMVMHPERFAVFEFRWSAFPQLQALFLPAF